jgi:hypothetical protein
MIWAKLGGPFCAALTVKKSHEPDVKPEELVYPHDRRGSSDRKVPIDSRVFVKYCATFID